MPTLVPATTKHSHLHKIADLDPNNTEIRLKLADCYSKLTAAANPRCVVQALLDFSIPGARQSIDAYSKPELFRDDRRHSAAARTHIARGTR